MMPAMNMPAMPQGQMAPGMPMMMPMLPGMMMPGGGMMPMMPNMMMPNMMMGMMPMMTPGMAPMFCRVTMEMGKDGMTCKVMPLDPAAMEMLRERWDSFTKTMATGVPMMMACGQQMLVCTR